MTDLEWGVRALHVVRVASGLVFVAAVYLTVAVVCIWLVGLPR